MGILKFWTTAFAGLIFPRRYLRRTLETPFGFSDLLKACYLYSAPVAVILVIPSFILRSSSRVDEAPFLFIQVLLGSPLALVAGLWLYIKMLPLSLLLVGVRIGSPRLPKTRAPFSLQLNGMAAMSENLPNTRALMRSSVCLNAAVLFAFEGLVLATDFILENTAGPDTASQIINIIFWIVGGAWLRGATVGFAATITCAVWRAFLGAFGLFVLLYVGLGLIFAMIANAVPVMSENR
jgi:hypothetical protein